jgi:trans-aconitate 2-methyltransferase
VRRESASSIADLGCGPGHLTEVLAKRWPAAQVVGVDNSPEMLEQARPLVIPSRLEFVNADIANWSPPKPLDLLVSNAALQWVPDHESLIPRLAGMLATGGTLAVQMPDRFYQSPAQEAINAAAADPRWASALQGVGLHRDSVKPLLWYIRRLHQLGFAVDAWETTYVHVLTGQDPVLQWLKGTALRPLLDRLHPALKEEFLQILARRLETAYPAEGKFTLFHFPRLFFVATR